ncbi:MAG: T9SS type A sorting domain-containing protein [Bacteroidota bacterium]
MKIFNFYRSFSCTVIFLLLFISSVQAGRPAGSGNRTPAKVMTNDTYHPMDINSIFNYYGNNGDGSLNPFSTDNEGFEFNKVTGQDIIFEEGIVWGGYQNGVLKVGGSTYNHGLQAGKILTWPGHGSAAPVADHPDLAKYRIYRIRPDITPSTPLSAVQDMLNATEVQDISRYESVSAQDIYNQYVKDWNEWPAADGAPFTDVNGDGVYDPNVDIPGVGGADQTMWYVANDLDLTRTKGLYGSDPIGIEQQRTVWAYKAGPGTEYLGYTIFTMTKLINKSGVPIDSIFISQWSDPDLGGSKGYNDDFVGCDTTRDLGFVYNGEPIDPEFGRLVPSGGYLLLQGPVVAGSASDSALYDFKFKHGAKPLRMSSFNFFVNGNATYSDPPFTADGTRQWYNLMNGLVGPSGAPYIDPITGLHSKFLLYGDPVTGSGWLDGSLAPPGDRRMCMIVGPFTFAPGDTQQIYVANSAALCGDRVSSVDKLKYYAGLLKTFYQQAFIKPPIPPEPKVTATNMNNEIVLNWQDSLSNAKIEGFSASGYVFQGYNVYQLRTNSQDLSSANAKRIQVWDKKDLITKWSDVVFDPTLCAAITEPVQFGGDFGVQRYLDIKTDAFGTYGSQLVNGEIYYFAVTAYALNTTPGLVGNFLESQVQVIIDTVRTLNPGNAVNTSSGNSVTDTTHIGTSDGSLITHIIDPTKITGDIYKVTISTMPWGTKVWNLVDSSKPARGFLVANDSVYDDVGSNPIVDGIQFGVLDPGVAGGFKQALLIKDSLNDYSSNPSNIMRTIDPLGEWAMDIINSTSRATAFGRMGGSDEGSDDYEIRFMDPATGSQYYADPSLSVSPGSPLAPNRLPMQFWDITVNKQLIPDVRDVDGDGKYSIEPNQGAGDISAPFTSGAVFEGIYVQNPATLGYYSEPLPNPATGTDVGFAIRRLLFINTVDTSSTAKFPVPPGTVIRLITNKPLKPNELFIARTGSLAAVSGNKSLALAEVNKINVYPNPYFGFNKAETDKYHRFVRFNHLPTLATIRIYNLAGILVRTIKKNDPGQFAQWDLMNENSIPAAAGIYVIFIDLPDLGTTKELKLAIIPETQYLDRY